MGGVRGGFGIQIDASLALMMLIVWIVKFFCGLFKFLGVFSIVWQWEFVLAFGAFCHVALYYGWAGSAGEGSAVAYVEGEVAFWTANYVFCLGHGLCHCGCLYVLKMG